MAVAKAGDKGGMSGRLVYLGLPVSWDTFQSINQEGRGDGGSPVSGVRLPRIRRKDALPILRNGKTDLPNARCAFHPISRGHSPAHFTNGKLRLRVPHLAHGTASGSSPGVSHPETHTLNLNIQGLISKAVS